MRNNNYRYKETNIPWIGKIPSDWTLVRGKYLFNRVKEINKNLKCKNLLSLTYDGVLNKDFYASEGLRPENYNTYQLFDKDDLVFKMIDLNNIKTSRVGIVHEYGIMSSAYIRFQTIKEKIYPKFAYWFFYDLYKKEIYNSIGSGVRSTLTSDEMSEFEIPVPTIKKQKIISHYLDNKTNQIDNLIKKIKKKIEILKEQRTSIINNCVTKGLDENIKTKESGFELIGEIPKHWSIKKLNWVSFFQEGPGLRNWQFTDQGIPVVSVTNIRPSGLTFKNYQRYISEDEYNLKYKHFTVENGDLLMASSGNSYGKICRYNGEFKNKFILNTSTIRMHSLDENIILTLYIKFLIESEIFQRQIKILITGAAQPNFGPTHLNQIRIPIPLIKEQELLIKFITNKTSKLDELIEKEKKRINLLSDYRNSLISAIITGKKVLDFESI